MCVCICLRVVAPVDCLSYFHLHIGAVFGNQDRFVGLAVFVDTFRNDLNGMDVSVLYSQVIFSQQALAAMTTSMAWPYL